MGRSLRTMTKWVLLLMLLMLHGRHNNRENCACQQESRQRHTQAASNT